MRLSVAVIASAFILCGVASTAVCQETYHGRGFVPPPFPAHRVEASAPRTLLPLPSRFDWREAGCVTPVKNQGSCGACYAFGALADFESKLLIAGEGAFDFSENNLKECEWFARNGFYPSGCQGGTYWRVVNLMAEFGTVLEGCDPYLAYNATCREGCPYIKTVLNWRVFTLSEIPPVETMKSYLMTKGPIFAAMDAGYYSVWQNELNSYDGSYTLYYDGSPTGPAAVNHSILIVGWDDTLSHAGGQGAWICKNSWGISWGGTAGYGTERGYFTIAYGSANLGHYASFIDEWKDYDACGRLLFYDEAGYYSQAGYGGVTAWGMCKFIMEEDAELRRVEFWTTDATTDVDIYIYDNFTGTTLYGLLRSMPDNSFGEMGYHSVPLPAYLEAAAGEDIYVAVKFTNAAYTWPLTTDAAGVGPTAPGMCHISPGGSTWEEFDAGDLGIRLRVHLMRDCDPPDPVSFFTAQGGDQRVTLRWTNPGDGDFSHAIIRYSASGNPISPEDGIAVENGNGGIFMGIPGGEDTFIHTGLVRNEAYYYSAFAADTASNYSEGSCAEAITDRWSIREEKFSEGDTPPLRGNQPDRAGSCRQVGGGVEISYLTVTEGSVELTVYDVSGRIVKTLYHHAQSPGIGRVTWDRTGDDGARVRPGVYFVRIPVAVGSETRKVVILR